MHEQETKVLGTNPEQQQQPPLLPVGPAFVKFHHAHYQKGRQMLKIILQATQLHSRIIQNKSS